MRPEGESGSPASAAYRAAGQECARERFYALACDPGRSVAVEACAGSGKTWMLVSRIVRALLDGAAPQEILALTFTRKAAGEMRERLHQDLQTWATCTPEQRVGDLMARGLERGRAIALEPALARLQERVAASGRQPAVLTINGWFVQLLSQAPMELALAAGLSADWQPMEEIDPLLPALWRRFHRWIRADAGHREDYRALLRGHPRARLEAWWRALLEGRAEVERADAAGTWAASVPAAAACWSECAAVADPAELIEHDPRRRQQLIATIEALLQHKHQAHREIGEKLAEAMAEPDLPQRFDAIWAALHKKTGDPRQAALKAPADELLATMQELARWRRQQRAHLDQQALVRLARGLMAQWRALKRERRVFDMVDLEQFAHRLLNDPVACGWVQQRLDQRWRQVLIDEFQDTSALQWQALAGWLSGYAGAGGGAGFALFVVGDPKQSIYRFRRAEPRVFEAAAELIVEGLGGVQLECDHSRRCGPAVRDLVNTVFERAQAEGDWSGFRPHSSEARSGLGAVRALAWIERPPPRRARAGEASASAAPAWRDSLTQARHVVRPPLRLVEAQRAADAVVALAAEAGLDWSQILVLSLKRDRLGDIAQRLRQRGVPCVAGEKLHLLRLPEVADLLALLDLLASPGHDLSLAQALRSPAFGADDAALAALALRAQAAAQTWSEALAAWPDAPPPLDQARRLLQEWAEPARRLAPHDLLDRIVADTAFLERAMARAQPYRRELARRAVQALLHLALQQDGGRCASPYRLVRRIRQAAARLPVPPQWNAVRLMTIHGAKGLEAQAVFLVDTDPKPASPHHPGLLVDWPVDQAAPRCLACVAAADTLAPSLEGLWEREQQARSRERINLLYVALTRAREWVVVSGTQPQHRGDGLSWWERLQDGVEPWPLPTGADQPPAGADGRDPAPLPTIAVPCLPVLIPLGAGAAAQRVATAPGPAGGTSADRFDADAARFGAAWHRVLEWALRPQAMPLPDLVAAAAQQARLSEAETQRLGLISRRLLDDRRFAAWLDPMAPGAANELTLAVDGDILRLDRLVPVQRDGRREWWVIDYKLSAAAGADPHGREQLGRYRAAVAALKPGEPVRAAFITAQGEFIELPASN